MTISKAELSSDGTQIHEQSETKRYVHAVSGQAKGRAFLTAEAMEYRNTKLAAEAGWIGLNEIWYDSVSLFMMNAFTQSK